MSQHVHPIETLEKYAMDDDVAHACLAMIRQGASEELAIATALEHLIENRARLMKMLERAAGLCNPGQWEVITEGKGFRGTVR